MIAIQCPGCGEKYYAEERHLGHHIRCRNCPQILTIKLAAPISTSSARQSVPRQPSVNAESLAQVINRTRNIGKFIWFRLSLAGVALGIFAVFIAATEFRPHHSPPPTELTPIVVQPPILNRSKSTTGGNKPVDPDSTEEVGVAGNPPERIPVSLPTGTWIISPHETDGNGSLKIRNGTDFDAAVKLVTATKPRRTIWMLYIRQNDVETIRKIGAGSYLLRFALGTDWDAASEKFLQYREFFQAGEQFDFAETESESSLGERGIEYDQIEVTLHLVPNGNLSRQPIDEPTFVEGDPNERN
jgi:hypothetical protein